MKKFYICLSFLIVSVAVLSLFYMTNSASPHEPKPPSLKTITTLETSDPLTSPAFDGTHYWLGNSVGEIFRISGQNIDNAKISNVAITSPITFAYDRFYFGDEAGIFYAMDSQFKVLWKWSTQDKIVGRALAWNNAIIFGSYDQNLYALNAHTGDSIWIYSTQGFINGSVVLDEANQALFFGNCDGILRKISLKTGLLLGEVDLESPIPSTPAKDAQNCYCITHNGTLSAWDCATLKQQWSTALSGAFISSPTCVGNTLWVTADRGETYILNRENGTLIHTLKTQHSLTAPVPASATHLWILSQKGMLYYVQNDSPFTVQSVHQFQADCSFPIFLNPPYLTVVDEDGALFIMEVLP